LEPGNTLYISGKTSEEIQEFSFISSWDMLAVGELIGDGFAVTNTSDDRYRRELRMSLSDYDNSATGFSPRKWQPSVDNAGKYIFPDVDPEAPGVWQPEDYQTLSASGYLQFERAKVDDYGDCHWD